MQTTECKTRPEANILSKLTLDPPRDSHLQWKLELVVVVVGGQVEVFVDAVQQPQQELQGVVLGVTPKLAPIFGHDGLEGAGEWEGEGGGCD